jgi:hypothetical protein
MVDRESVASQSSPTAIQCHSLSASRTSFTTRALADTAQHEGQAFGELDIGRAPQRIDNPGELARREDEVHTVVINIRPRVVSRI